MEKIKNISDLKKLRDTYVKDFNGANNKTRIIVGMATCGIAAGAGDVFDSIAGEIMKLGLEDQVMVVRSGCMGACHSEPTVEIVKPGKEPVLYGNVDSQSAKAIVKNHILRDEIVSELVLEKAFRTVG